MLCISFVSGGSVAHLLRLGEASHRSNHCRISMAISLNSNYLWCLNNSKSFNAQYECMSQFRQYHHQQKCSGSVSTLWHWPLSSLSLADCVNMAICWVPHSLLSGLSFCFFCRLYVCLPKMVAHCRKFFLCTWLVWCTFNGSSVSNLPSISASQLPTYDFH